MLNDISDVEGDVNPFGSWPAGHVAQPSNMRSEKLSSATHTPIAGTEIPTVAPLLASTSQTNEILPSRMDAMYEQGPQSAPPAVVKLHSDSGVRLPPGQVVDIPPAYTDD